MRTIVTMPASFRQARIAKDTWQLLVPKGAWLSDGEVGSYHVLLRCCLSWMTLAFSKCDTRLTIFPLISVHCSVDCRGTMGSSLSHSIVLTSGWAGLRLTMTGTVNDETDSCAPGLVILRSAISLNRWVRGGYLRVGASDIPVSESEVDPPLRLWTMNAAAMRGILSVGVNYGNYQIKRET